jgi:hypothetical protein
MAREKIELIGQILSLDQRRAELFEMMEFLP